MLLGSTLIVPISAVSATESRHTSPDSLPPCGLRSAGRRPGPPSADHRPGAAFTRREHDVAALLAPGLTNRTIGVAPGISERTVEMHVGNIRAKLGLASRTQVAVWATERGLAATPRVESVAPAGLRAPSRPEIPYRTWGFHGSRIARRIVPWERMTPRAEDARRWPVRR